MQYWNLVIISFFAITQGACTSLQTKPVAKLTTTPTVKSTTAVKSQQVKESASPTDSSNDAQEIISIDIIGKPLPGGKFAKLKIGMSKEQVEAIIGAPDRKWQQATGKDSTPYYSGTDRWLIQSTYANEGMLTFNLSPQHLLIRILVNRAE